MIRQLLSLAALPLVSLAAPLAAQSLFDAGLQWNIDRNSSSSPESVTERFRIGGDTLVDGRTYRKVLMSTSASDDDFRSTEFLLRADGADRVVLRASGEEGVLYDFGAGVGDTIRQFNRYRPEAACAFVVVATGDTTLADGIPRRLYRARAADDPGRASAVVEGIGALRDGLLGIVGCILDVGTTLRCVYRDDTLLLNPSGGDCFTSSITESRALAASEVYPNPFADFIVLDLASERFARYDLVDQLGATVMAGQIEGRGYIDASALPAGVYVLRIGYADGAAAHARVVKL